MTYNLNIICMPGLRHELWLQPIDLDQSEASKEATTRKYTLQGNCEAQSDITGRFKVALAQETYTILIRPWMQRSPSHEYIW